MLAIIRVRFPDTPASKVWSDSRTNCTAGIAINNPTGSYVSSGKRCVGRLS